MSNIPISSLPLAISLDGNEDVPIVQGGTTKRTTVADIASKATGFVPDTRRVDAGVGLSGGGPLSSDVTLNLDIFDLTPTPAMAVVDSFAINNVASGNQPLRATFPNAMKALTGLAALAIPDLTHDYLIINRASDGNTYKVNPSSLGLAYGNMPAGGATGQFLAKNSNTNYDTIWTNPSILLDPVSVAANPTNAQAFSTSVTGSPDQVLVINAAGTSLGFSSIDLSKPAAVGTSVLQIENGGAGTGSGETVITSGPTYPSVATDARILVAISGGAALTITLLASASYGQPILVKDLLGFADSTGPITVSFTGGELADGLSSVPITTAYGAYWFTPSPAGGFYLGTG